MIDPAFMIIVPAHNEEETIGDTLRSIRSSIKRNFLDERRVMTVVVCDSCTDRTAAIARTVLVGSRSLVVEEEFRNVGMAREFGARRGSELFPEVQWLVFTDADTLVGANWLRAHQRAFKGGYDAYCGRVEFEVSSPILQDFAHLYTIQTHKRIHGANLGIKAEAYWTVGGMPKLACHEDKVLVETLESHGYLVQWEEKPTVRTSVRLEGRAPEGFAATLKRFAQSRVLAI